MREMLNEFKKFAMRGNVVDLAIGVVIGAAFSRIVESIVADIFMPIIGMFGSVDFSNLFIRLNSGITATSLAEARRQGAVLAWGNFVTVTINFVIVAFVLFLVVKLINRLRHEEAQKPAAPPEPTTSEKLLMEIRDALKSR